MSRLKFPHLFEPIILNSAYFFNRVFSESVYNPSSGCNFIPDRRTAAIYERRAMGGSSCVAVCNVPVDACSFDDTDDDYIQKLMQNLTPITRKISSYGSVPLAGLTHRFDTQNIPAPSALSSSDITSIIDRYVYTARILIQSGFRMLSLDALKCGLLKQFLSSECKASAAAQPGRIVSDIADAIRDSCGKNIPVSLSICEDDNPLCTIDRNDIIDIAASVSKKLDLIHLYPGWMADDDHISKGLNLLGDSSPLDYSENVRRKSSVPIAVSCNVVEPELFEDILTSNKADILSFSNQLCADPDMPSRLRMGKSPYIRRCAKCLACIYNEQKNKDLLCAINPEYGLELELKYDIPEAQYKKTVLIAGGGPAGMQAALTCAKRGHAVIICEKTEQLGGALRCMDEVPSRRSLVHYLDQQAMALADARIDVRLNSEVDTDYISDLHPDVVIAAIGSAPLRPKITGAKNSNVFSIEEAYSSFSQLGKQISILGADADTMEIALYLASRGKKTAIYEEGADYRTPIDDLRMKRFTKLIKEAGIPVYFSMKPKNILKTKITFTTADGAVSFPSNSVVYSLGRQPRLEEAIKLHKSAPEFYMLGDCVHTGGLAQAVREAFFVARNIGRN